MSPIENPSLKFDVLLYTPPAFCQGVLRNNFREIFRIQHKRALHCNQSLPISPQNGTLFARGNIGGKPEFCEQ